MLRDYRTSAVEAKWIALLALIEKLVRNSSPVTEGDVDAAKRAGWHDETIYDAVTVVALFMFYNTWVGGCGVPPLNDYGPSGKRLATEGYA